MLFLLVFSEQYASVSNSFPTMPHLKEKEIGQRAGGENSKKKEEEGRKMLRIKTI